MANLNADRQAIERALTIELGTMAMPTHFANPVSIIHEKDSMGNRKVIQAIMIVPTSDDFTGLEHSIASATAHSWTWRIQHPRGCITKGGRACTARYDARLVV